MTEEFFLELVNENYREELREGAAKDPKVQALALLAWDYGHPNGLAEVRGYFEEMIGAYKNAEQKF